MSGDASDSAVDGHTIDVMRRVVALGLLAMLSLVAAACSTSDASTDSEAYATADGQEIVLGEIEGPAVLIFWDPG